MQFNSRAEIRRTDKQTWIRMITIMAKCSKWSEMPTKEKKMFFNSTAHVFAQILSFQLNPPISPLMCQIKWYNFQASLVVIITFEFFFLHYFLTLYLPHQCCLLIRFAVWTQIRPNIMSGLIWIQTFDILMVISRGNFLKILLFCLNWRMTKSMQNYPACKEF